MSTNQLIRASLRSVQLRNDRKGFFERSEVTEKRTDYVHARLGLNKMAATHLYRSAATCSVGEEGDEGRTFSKQKTPIFGREKPKKGVGVNKTRQKKYRNTKMT